MRVDVSEVKARRECGRKWALSSRNYFHIKPKSESPNLTFGSIFHEALASLYLSRGVSERVDSIIDKYVSMVEDDNQRKQMACMLIGYSDKVLPADLERYRVLDVEYHFRFTPPKRIIEIVGKWAEDIEICGSVDLVLLDKSTGKILGLEHKTCKNFRSEFYNFMDEQPRVYCLALDRYVEEYNRRNNTEYTNGGIVVNEVRKLKTRFEYHRMEAIVSTPEQSFNFLVGFLRTANQIKSYSESSSGTLPPPEPGYMKCNMCDFRSICSHYSFSKPKKEEILDEFAEEFEEREFDHLDEKVQRSGETEDAVPESNS